MNTNSFANLMKLKKAYRSRSSDFLTTWSKIKFNADSSKDEPCKNPFNPNSIALQHSLTFSNNFDSQETDWSSYHSLNLNNELTIQDYYFGGTLNHIYSNSNYKLNTSEVTFYYTGASKRKFYDSESDIVNIFDPTNLDSTFPIQGEGNECFFGLTYNNIQLEPNLYSFAQDQTKGWPFSFEFDAYDEFCKEWVVLDERMNVDLRNINFFGARPLNKSFSSFRIKQTAPGNNDLYAISLAYFEIHGIVSKRNSNFLNEVELDDPNPCIFEAMNALEFPNESDYNNII